MAEQTRPVQTPEKPRKRSKQSTESGSQIQSVTFLGTSSACPMPGIRNTSGIALTTDGGGVILMDCGEGVLGFHSRVGVGFFDVEGFMCSFEGGVLGVCLWNDSVQQLNTN